MISPILPIRIAQLVLSIITLGVSAYVVTYFDGTIDSLNFVVFCCVWTWLALAYLLVVPQFLPFLHHQYAVLAVEAVTVIFWFAGFIAWAAFLGQFHLICNGVSWCGAAKASVVFSAFMWLLFVASLALVIRAVLVQRKNGAGDAPNLSGLAGIGHHQTGAAPAVAPNQGHDMEHHAGFNPSSTPAPYSQSNTPAPYDGSHPQFQQHQQPMYAQSAEMPSADPYGGSNYSAR